MKNLSLIIPAKYEKESLPKVLTELKKYKLKTYVILEKTDIETIHSIKNFKVNIIHQKSKGYGNALIKGIKKVKTKYFIIFNADGSFNPKEIKKIENKAIYKKYDMVFASRYEDKNSGSTDDTIVTFIGNKIFTLIGKIFFSLPISDILYTYVLCDTKKTKRLNLKSFDFRFCVELPIKAIKKNYRMTSISSYERPRIAGKKKVNAIRDGFLILISMIKLFFDY